MFQVIVKSCKRFSLSMCFHLDHHLKCCLCTFCTLIRHVRNHHHSFLFFKQFAHCMLILSQLAQFYVHLKHLVLQVWNVVLCFALTRTTVLQCIVEQKMHNFWLMFFSQVEAVFASRTFVQCMSHRLFVFLMSTVNCDCTHFWSYFNDEHSQSWIALILKWQNVVTHQLNTVPFGHKLSSTIWFASSPQATHPQVEV